MTDSPGRLLTKEGRETPRRIQVQKMTPAELSIRAAVDEVEKLPPDQRLTSAVRLLQMARERVADFVDGKPEEEWARRGLDNLASAFAADDLADALLASKDARIAELEEQVATTEQLRFEENRKACDRRDRIWELEALLAEQAARLAEREWRDMESAPKDGSKILAWCVHANARHAAIPDHPGWAFPVIAYWINHNSGGFANDGGVPVYYIAWMPLPAAPRAPMGS